MENQNRSIFSIHGITGMLIATVLLLSILGVLTYLGIGEQQSVMQKPYSLEKAENIQKFSKDSEKHMVIK
ncbi:periplasmic protein [Campylobacter sputorum subsp. bubulus]|uniref:Periplasmic protein n=1 Tax=Campylobacter sputorum subsp. sputorum TaxID=32024 RepID=A0A381DK27_9BACT|nr:DUF4006 family protein [Campylobacter sputorum]ASM34378.1 DUF4006 domain protein [Campylobacter sputorum aubsp. sputorum RM3237]ASM37726.1 DUF4006 domain protein [Campylobacter sputorum bv. paraureolyticus LMG 11764]KAB0582231.1 DUF4006 family protein [Campylobacter sputorum subsp. sputorum]MDY6119976.1 DUF4006 family protein [Campylobacter sputorum]QEL04569.1 DUF4006 domain-containing protein [Campylobacter sputorum subsp. sputorum]